MCFGDQQTSTKTSTPSANVTSAANSNLNFVQNLQNQGFQGYSGPQVANLSPGQQSTITNANSIVNDGTGAAAKSLIGGYTGAPASSVNANTIASQMSPYMNQYVMQALAPQLHQQDVTFAKNRAATDAQATGSGAFGDARTGIEQSNNNFNDATAREGLIGNAYNSAFNTAIGAGAQDVSNKLGADTTNANLNETALNRQLSGATALQGVQAGQLANQTTANTLNQQNTATDQANLTAQYNQWLMKQQYPFQTAGLVNSTVGAANPASPTTTTESQPDNSGYALIGTALGTAAKLSDIRYKEDIDHVGELFDGTPVFSYAYKGDPLHRKELGLMAQDIKRRNPKAVVTLDDDIGTMMVDYGKATEQSRLLASLAI